ncbi:related to protein SUE1, mitochondrial [Zygosaccharomyces bailii]|nr:related to protein SUE1, mitochondrial [Zygosaccharomyces bailii]
MSKRLFSTVPVHSFKRKSCSSDIFRSLPRVPTTQFLESRELTRDILFSGYRPVMYPVKENPLFKERRRNGELTEQQSGELRQDSEKEYMIMAGPRGCGGIASGGVNGTWRNGARMPSKLLPYNWWSTTSMGMEFFPEWEGVPRHVMRKLRPFDREHEASNVDRWFERSK